MFLDRLGMRFGAHVGPKRPSWLHLGRLGLDDGKRSMALAIGDWSFGALAKSNDFSHEVDQRGDQEWPSRFREP